MKKYITLPEVSGFEHHHQIQFSVIPGCDFVCLVEFFGISTIIGYLMPNPVFTYISYIWFVIRFCWYTQLKDQTVLFVTIQYRINQQS